MRQAQAQAQQTGDISLPVQPRCSIDDPDQYAWDAQTDVVVVGLGAAGAASALAAREQGSQVLILDRFDLGGATARSGGVVYAGGGTRQQHKIGVQDSPEAMFAYLQQEVGDAVSAKTLQRFCRDSVGLIEWLESLGAEFDASPQPPKTSYPRDGVYLYYSGNEAITGFREHAAPAPRGHRTVDKGLSGRRLYAVLYQAVLASGAIVRAPSAAQRLLCGPDGRVVGIESRELQPGSAHEQAFRRLTRRAEAVHNFAPGLADRWRRRAAQLEDQHAVVKRIRARQAVILSTGGFVFNRQMLAEHAPAYLPNMRLGTAGCDGSGIRLGQSAGGTLGCMDKVSAWRFINPPQAWAQGIVVNQQGQRFCNESSYGARIGVAMCEQQQGKAWLLLDKAARKQAWREAFFGRLWIFQSVPAMLLMLLAPKAATLEALAAKVGLPAPALKASVQACQQAFRNQRADPMGKLATQRSALNKPGYAALDMSSDNPMFPCPAITLGGLQVAEDSGQVLAEDGQPIAGLYAAGRAAVGVASNNYVSGLSLADCLWSGRRAGGQAASENK